MSVHPKNANFNFVICFLSTYVTTVFIQSRKGKKSWKDVFPLEKFIALKKNREKSLALFFCSVLNIRLNELLKFQHWLTLLAVPAYIERNIFWLQCKPGRTFHKYIPLNGFSICFMSLVHYSTHARLHSIAAFISSLLFPLNSGQYFLILHTQFK